MFRLVLVLLGLSTPVSAATTFSYFTFDYNMGDMAYVRGDTTQAGTIPAFDVTLFLTFDTAIPFLTNGTFTHENTNGYLEIPDTLR